MSIDELEKILSEEELVEESESLLIPHQHFWQFQLNANHTLVRGCIHCGQAYATLVMGAVENLQWHRIQEPSE